MISSEQVSAAQSDRVDLLAMSRVVWKYRYLISCITLFAGAVAVALALTAKPIFRAEVVVVEVSDDSMNAAASLASQFGGLANLVGVNLAGGGGGKGQEAQATLKSRRMAEEFITRYELLPVLSAGKKESGNLWLTVRAFRERVLAIKEDKRTGLTSIGMSWGDPQVAARWANDYVALVNEQLRTRALKESETNIAYLNSQLELTTSVELRKVMYGLIENEMRTLMLARARAEYAFAVMDPAVAAAVRSSPHRSLMVLLGLAFGFLIGLIVAFTMNTVRNEMPK